MNAKLLYAVTVVAALVSSLAVAAENDPLTRGQVIADYRQAAANGTLRRNDYDFDRQDGKGVSPQTRAEVVAALLATRPNPALIGPMRNRSYNPGGMEALRAPSVNRDVVKSAVVSARRDGTLRRTDYDDETVHAARRAPQRTSASVLAGKANASASGS